MKSSSSFIKSVEEELVKMCASTWSLMSSSAVLLLVLLVLVSGTQSQDIEPRLGLMPAGDVQLKAMNSMTMVSCQAFGVTTPLLNNNIRWLDITGKEIQKEQTLRKYSEFAKGTLMLLIRDTKPEDRGTYTCVADYEGRELTTSFELKTYMDLTWVDVPPLQHPRANSSGYIRCKVSAEPAPEVDWSLNNKPVVFNEGDRCQNTAEGIFCQPILKEDDGNYTCRARVLATGKIEERVILVEVHTPPKIHNLTKALTVVEDERVIVTCMATGDPRPFYSWEDKNNANLKDRPGYLVDEDLGTLVIERASKGDNGSVQCIANNSAGEDTRQTFLTVVVKPKILKFDNETVMSSEKGKLACHVHAESHAVVEFVNLGTHRKYFYQEEDDTFSEERIHVSVSGQVASDGITHEKVYTLEFASVERMDDGLYECIASNKGGSVSAIGHLQVEYAPEFTATQGMAWSWIDNPVNLSCSVNAIPNATITWTFSGNPVSDYQNMKVFDSDHSSTLYIYPTDNSYFGSYVCRASNKLGDRDKTIELSLAHAPGEIKQVIFRATATTIMFTFFGPDEVDGFPVTHFAVEYQEADAIEQKRRIWDIDTPYILEKLEPEKRYNFRFAAVNKVGDGEWKEHPTFTMPAKAPPVEPPIPSAKENVVTHSSYSDRYELTWNIPADNGDKITLFLINYCEVRNASVKFEKIGEWTTERIPHPGQTSYTITGLKPDTLYKIEIRAQNSIGNSLPSILVIQTTKDPNYVSIPKKENRPSIPLDASSEPQATMAGMSLGIIIAIAVIILVVVLVLIDISCYVANNCGVFMFLCVHVCKKQPSSEKVKEAAMEEGGGKHKDSKETMMVAAEPVVAEDDDAKDATEETPMIDGRNDKEPEKVTSLDNDTNKTNKDNNAVAV